MVREIAAQQKICSTLDESNCVITNIDHYTSSFNWQATNFAAIWLRPLWYLFINSALTDVQNGGITFVTGGGYTKSDAINGHWALARKDVFIGNTQDSAANSVCLERRTVQPGDRSLRAQKLSASASPATIVSTKTMAFRSRWPLSPITSACSASTTGLLTRIPTPISISRARICPTTRSRDATRNPDS